MATKAMKLNCIYEQHFLFSIETNLIMALQMEKKTLRLAYQTRMVMTSFTISVRCILVIVDMIYHKIYTELLVTFIDI